MEGMLFVGGLIAGSTVVALRSNKASVMPGAVFVLAILAACYWYVFV